jgi:hypothetical protein
MNVPQGLWRNFVTFWSDSTSSIVYLTGVILNTSVELLKVKSQEMFLYMFWGNFTVCSELKSKMATLASDGLKHIWCVLRIGWNRPIAYMPDHHKMARNVPQVLIFGAFPNQIGRWTAWFLIGCYILDFYHTGIGWWQHFLLAFQDIMINVN